MSPDHVIDPHRLRRLLAGDDRSPAERDALIRLMRILADLGEPPAAGGVFPRYRELRRRWLAACLGNDAEALEESFLELYAHLHMHEAP